MELSFKISKNQTDQLLAGWIYDIIRTEETKSKAVILEKVGLIIDEHNAYLEFKKDYKYMQVEKGLTYYDDYLEKVETVSPKPKEMNIKNLIENHFKRWLRLKQGTEYKFLDYNGRAMPTNTFRAFLYKDKDYIIDDGKILNLKECWKDCKIE